MHQPASLRGQPAGSSLRSRDGFPRRIGPAAEQPERKQPEAGYQ